MTISASIEYRVIPGWERLPTDLVHRDASDVAVDSHDRVYLLTRMDPRVIVYDRDGSFLTTWGEDILSAKPHGITIGPDDAVYIVDEADQTVRKFAADGTPLAVIGTPGVKSDTGFDNSIREFRYRVASIKQAGPPFNHPTKAAVAPNGDLYVADGYGNARVHHFSPEGELIHSWGEPGSGPGQFRVPHGICFDGDGRVLVADRENDRVQFFRDDGKYLDSMTLRRPCSVAVDKDGLLYVGGTWWAPGAYSWVRGTITGVERSQVSVLDRNGKLLAQFGEGGGPSLWPDDACEPGVIVSAHGIAVDSRGDIYVASPTHSSLVRLVVPEGHRAINPDECLTLQKMARVS
jgi:sugar lactone lactonase YvrE